MARGSLVEVEGLQRPRVKNQKTGCCLLTPRAKQPTSVDRWVYKPFRGQVGLLGGHGHRHAPTCPSPPQGTSSISLSLSPSPPFFLPLFHSLLPLFPIYLSACLSSLPYFFVPAFLSPSLCPFLFPYLSSPSLLLGSLFHLFFGSIYSLPLSLLRTTH